MRDWFQPYVKSPAIEYLISIIWSMQSWNEHFWSINSLNKPSKMIHDSQLGKNQLDVFSNPTMLLLEIIYPKLDQFFLLTLDLLISSHMSLKLLMMWLKHQTLLYNKQNWKERNFLDGGKDSYKLLWLEIRPEKMFWNYSILLQHSGPDMDFGFFLTDSLHLQIFSHLLLLVHTTITLKISLHLKEREILFSIPPLQQVLLQFSKSSFGDGEGSCFLD